MTDTWQNSPAVSYPTTNPAPAAPPAQSPYDRAIARIEGAQADAERTFQQQQSALAPRYSAVQKTLDQPLPTPPQQQRVEPAPKPEDFQKYSMAFAGAMAVLGAVAGRYTRMTGQLALNSFTGALKGWQEGNLEAYQQHAKEWEQNTKATIENNNQVLGEYKQALENRRLNIDQQMSQIQLIAAQYHDKMMFDAATAKNYTMVAQLYSKQQQYTDKVKQSADVLIEKRREQTQKMESSGAKSAGTQTPEKIALQRFLKEHPDATAEDIQRFRNQGKQPRSAQGLAVSKFMQEHPEATADDVQNFVATQAGKTAEERTGAVKAANLDIIMRNAHAAIPQALEASKNVPRGTWVPINRLVQAADSQISDPALKEFRLANLQLAELWARAMNPSGVMRESDRQLALDMLSTADSPQTYERVAKQLENFLNRERQSVREFRQHVEPGQPFNPSAASPTTGGPLPPGDYNWTPDKGLH